MPFSKKLASMINKSKSSIKKILTSELEENLKIKPQSNTNKKNNPHLLKDSSTSTIPTNKINQIPNVKKKVLPENNSKKDKPDKHEMQKSKSMK